MNNKNENGPKQGAPLAADNSRETAGEGRTHSIKDVSEKHPLAVLATVAVAAAGIAAGAVQMLVVGPRDFEIARLERVKGDLEKDLAKEIASGENLRAQVTGNIQSAKTALSQVPPAGAGPENPEVTALRERLALLESLVRERAVGTFKVGDKKASSLVSLAASKIGQPYILGARAPMTNSKWNGPWDSAEFVSWVVYQVSGTLAGTRPTNDPVAADAFTGFWVEDAEKIGKVVDVETGAQTPGAVLVRVPLAGRIGHVAISDGEGSVIEAGNSRVGIRRFPVNGQKWDKAILLNGIVYP